MGLTSTHARVLWGTYVGALPDTEERCLYLNYPARAGNRPAEARLVLAGVRGCAPGPDAARPARRGNLRAPGSRPN